MPGNYNSLTGYGFNPYDPRRDPRPATADGRPVLVTGGSSSGVGTAVSFWAANVGTETSGSILTPSNQTMLAGIKPTVGRISRYGIIPITADQDTAGPMARTVADAAILLGALEGATPDPNDRATSTCMPPPGARLHAFPRRRRVEGCAHRHPARILLRTGHGARRERAERRPQRRSAEGDGRRDRRSQGSGRQRRRSCRHSQRRGPGPRPQFPGVADLQRRRQREGARMPAARSCSSTG